MDVRDDRAFGLGRVTSFSQQRLWFLDRLRPGSADYLLPMTLRILGDLDVTALTSAVQAIVDRHEILRTRYLDVDGEALPHVEDHAPVTVARHDLSGVPAADRDARLAELVDRELRRPFDLRVAPPLRLTLVRVGPGEHLLILIVHHIAFDFGSWNILSRELAAGYRERTGGPPADLPPLVTQYADVAQWQRDRLAGPRLVREMDYWRSRLAGLGALDLPTDRPRPTVWDGTADVLWFEVSEEIVTTVDRFARSRRCTRFMVLLAAFDALLAHHTGRTDLAVGTPVSGRTRVEAEALIGLFVNTVVLRADLSGEPTFTELLRQVRDTTLSGLTHAEAPFDRIVTELVTDRDLSRNPLFQVSFSVLNGSIEPMTLAGLAVRTIRTPSNGVPVDLVLDIVVAPDGRTSARLQYATALFDRSTMERFGDAYLRLLNALLASPDVPTGDIARRTGIEPPDSRQRSAARGHDLTMRLFDGEAPPTAEVIGSDPVLLPLGGWRMWGDFALRGPGFPVAGVLSLAPPGLAAAADDPAAVGPGRDAFAVAFADAAADTARVLQGVARDSRFRAALAWQNRAVLSTGVTPFLNWEPTAASRTSMPRQREELVAHYWQRLCVKNDTIGFFGPVGWGRWDLATRGVTTCPGRGLTTSAEVFFPSWTIDGVARLVGADPGIREWIAPRRVPFVRIVDGRVWVPSRPPRDISHRARTVLELCDGRRRPAALADDASKLLGRELSRPELTTILEALVARRWVVWRIEIPASTYPERHLRDILDGVDDPDIRESALNRLDIIERGRERIGRAGRDDAALIEAFTALETDYRTLIGSVAQRSKSARTPASRALVYADTRRSASIRLGRGILDALAPLGLCLAAARWFADRFAEVMTKRIRNAYDGLLARQGSVDLASLWFACLPAPHPASVADIEAIRDESRRRWAAIVNAPEGARRVQLSGVDIAGRVLDAFGEPGTGWPQSRYVSPDVMIIAADRDALERGDVDLVLGELHVAMNTLTQSLFVTQHPDRDRLIAEVTTDFPGPRVTPMLPKEMPPKWSARNRPALDRPEDYLIAIVHDTADPHRPRTAMAGDVPVVERDGELAVVLPDGAVFGLIDVFGHALTNRVMDGFSLRPDADHAPRITIDRMTVARETWRFDPAVLAFATEKDEARRFVRARGWRRSHDLPRYVFVVSPTEPRPFYVDFDSPVYVNILAKAVRRLAREDPSARLSVTEMLPTPEQAWLTDDDGNVYTSELRFVAVDQTRDAAVLAEAGSVFAPASALSDGATLDAESGA